MPNPIVTTIELTEEYISNNNITFKGNTINNGWETLEWGFWWYKKSEGIGTKEYIAASTTPLGEGDFQKLKGSLLPFTEYMIQARCYYKKWNEGLETWDYIEIFGEWIEAVTHAYCHTSQIYACNIDKDSRTADFHADVYESDGGNCIERGFEYGLTRVATWKVSEEGNFSKCMFSLPASDLPVNSDFYVRGYLKSASGHYAYTRDGIDGGWRKVTTKKLMGVIAATSNAGWLPTNCHCYLIIYDINGQEINSYPIGEGHYIWRLTVNKDGIIFIGDEYLSQYSIKSFRMSDGAFLSSFGAPSWIKGICVGKDEFIYTLEGTTVKKRHPVSLNVITTMPLTGTNFQGLTLDEDGLIYVNRTDTSPDKIEKYRMHPLYDIIAVQSGGAGMCSFSIAGDHTAEFTAGNPIIISGSTGNNGTYTITMSSYGSGKTWIPVDEAVPSPVADGQLRDGRAYLQASIDSPIANMGFSDLAVMGDHVYSGAYYDYPIKAPKDLSSCEEWHPAGEWHEWNRFWVIQPFNGKTLLEGNPDNTYLRRIALYNESEEQIWNADIVGSLDGISGYPFTGGATLINIKAEKIAGHLSLYGEMTERIASSVIVERGFEYKIQDAEPGEEDTGTEVKETGEGFEIGEFHLSSWDTFNDLYRAEENKIWWFRTYCKDIEDNKYKAETWMKNVPTLTTFECTEVYAQEAKGNGELTDKGANIVTKKGFRIIKIYRGDIWGAKKYTSSGFKSLLERRTTYAENGVITGFEWIGILYRDSLYEDAGGYELGIYDKILGGGFSGEGFGLYLKPNDKYKIVAIGENQLGMGFGEDFYIITEENILSGETILSRYLSTEYQNMLDGLIGFDTGQLILPSDDEIVSNISAEKTITLGTIPYGATVTRIGIRLGRTMGCNEIHVYEDGEWGSGQGVTFFITDFVPGASYYKMPYIVINYGDHEEEVLGIPDYRNPERLEEWLEDYPIEVFPEVEDEDELDQTIIDSSVGDISYRTIIKEIKCERIGEQSFIDRYGRRRSQTIDNHLIQSRANCKIIVDDYIDKFQILKQKYALEYDIPLPFEREDVILLGDGKTKYKDDGQGLIAFKADGEGEMLQEDFILAKIRKIDGRFISGKEAILNLELEV